MHFVSTIQLVFRTLRARKGRSLLTILGIVIGVSGVITIIALGAGAQSLVLGQVTKLGSNLLSIQPGKNNEKGPPASVFGITVTTLINEDAEALRNNNRAPHVTAVTAIARGSGTVTWENKSIDTNFVGVDHYYPQVSPLTLTAGQFLDERQDQAVENVAILGASVREQLFDSTGVDPIGQIIKVKSITQTEAGGVPLRIIGVVAARGSVFGQDQDDQIYVPIAIAQGQLLGRHYVDFINAKIDSADAIPDSTRQINDILMSRHHITSEADADYTIRSLADAVSILTTITNALRVFLASMAGIALVVGGIGILNIMLATVAERTREIGLRKAVGANNAAVRNQFLLEAGTLTFLGGIIGIIFGVLISYGAAVAITGLGYDWKFEISIMSVVLAVGVSILTGVVFGLYPAYKASRLNPIEALRYE